MAFFEILSLVFKYLKHYSYKKSKYLVKGIKSFTPEVSISFEEGIFGPWMNFPYNLIEKILQLL